MPAAHDNIRALYEKWVSQTATEEDVEALFTLLEKENVDESLSALMKERWENAAYARHYSDEEVAQRVQAIMERYPAEEEDQQVPVHRIHFLRTAWFRYAAAIIVLFGIGTYVYINNQKEKPSVTTNSPVPVQNDVAPGGNKAILTLADGSKIVLDSAKSGVLAREENATITKTTDGKIVYDPNEKIADKISFNTMATPRGGQYQLTLPDGSQVWLNAESSITYPTAFPGKERKVTITGEAYFEVTKDARKPFRVLVVAPSLSHPERSEGSPNEPLEIEVLGTHFNVNAYTDEASINTTLLEGSVKITADSRLPTADNAVHTSLTLKPGQQGQLKENKLTLASNPDIEQVMAWKNGTFYFESADLKAIMRQLARWYDLDVEYEGNVTQRTFSGEIDRNLTLTQVLNGLTQTRIKYRIQGKKITILP